MFFGVILFSHVYGAAAGWKSNQIAMLQETIMYLAHQAARKHHSAPDIGDHQLG